MKKTIQLRWLLASLLLFSVAAPVNAEISTNRSVLVAQADKANTGEAKAEETPESATTEGPKQQGRPVVAQTKEGKYALAIVVGAVILLFVLIFVKSSKLD